MYPHFIEVHGWRDDRSVSLNIDNIVSIHPSVDKDHSIVNVNHDDGYYTIQESYDELKQMIKGAGCLIQMGDPRLDTSHPLTMQDLRQMIGEPVWDNNSMQWNLVMSVDSTDEGNFVILTTSNGVGHDRSETDLVAKPLYRMKVNNDGK